MPAPLGNGMACSVSRYLPLAARGSASFISTAWTKLFSCKIFARFAATSVRSSIQISRSTGVAMFHNHACWLGVKASSLTRNVPRSQESVGCPICSRDLTFTYKDVLFLSQFLSPEGHMLNRRVTGVCGKQQKKLEKAIKISRRLGLLPRCGPASA